MTADLLTYGLPALVAAIAGAAAGGLTAWKLNRPEPAAEIVPGDAATGQDADDTEFINAEIDLAAVRWAEVNNLPPEAAALFSARLKTAHAIGQRKGWF